jgi:adenine/guanine phosphoribosyltransferase-like PRPP-binding protein
MNLRRMLVICENPGHETAPERCPDIVARMQDRYLATVGTQRVPLPLIPLSGDLAIALLMTIDMGVAFMSQAGSELAEALAPAEPECIVSMATLGIPVALEVTRALGLDDYLILQKTPKVHLRDSLRSAVDAITTDATQYLLLDRRRVDAVRGKRVALVDDVISTGGSMSAALRLLDEAGANVVAVGALLSEGELWRERLGPRADLVRTLGTIPVFVPGSDGGWEPKPE